MSNLKFIESSYGLTNFGGRSDRDAAEAIGLEHPYIDISENHLEDIFKNTVKDAKGPVLRAAKKGDKQLSKVINAYNRRIRSLGDSYIEGLNKKLILGYDNSVGNETKSGNHWKSYEQSDYKLDKNYVTNLVNKYKKKAKLKDWV